jgi:mono/diheme cytochrome c family protein
LPGRRPLLHAVLVTIPLLTGWNTWRDLQPDTTAPAAFRVIHPAPPSTVSVHGTSVDTKAGVNPFRHLEKDDPPAFAAAVTEGRRVYYQNCYFCHGDELAGDGHFAKALNPRPISFMDQTTIAMFTETFIFWRVAKGGPGLPTASTPWDSAMPAWEDYLTNDEMWKVILYLYDRTEQVPRALAEVSH